MCRKLQCPVIGGHESPETAKFRNAHVVIRKNGGDVPSVMVDGVEMNMLILAGSLQVNFPDDAFEDARVTFTLAANVEIDADAKVVEK